MTTVQLLYPVTDAKAHSLRTLLVAMGVPGARVRKMRNGACRVVLKSRAHRDAARDAFVLANACTASGRLFTHPDSRHAWNGEVEIFLRFATK